MQNFINFRDIIRNFFSCYYQNQFTFNINKTTGRIKKFNCFYKNQATWSKAETTNDEHLITDV